MLKRTIVLVSVLLAVAPPARAGAVPVVYAHRGGSAIAPENTLGAFRQAHALFGARGVWLELDTQLTADGVSVVMHDDSVDRTTNCTGDVITLTAAQITACDARRTFPSWPQPEYVPTLAQVLTEGKAAGWRLMVEIKGIPTDAGFDGTGTMAPDALITLVRQSGYPLGDLVVQSFWPPALDRIELLAPEISTSLLTTSQLPGAPPGVGFTATENGAFSKARGYEMIEPDVATLDLRAETVDAIHALGLPVVLWTINDAARMTQAAGWGVDGIITDRPDLAYATLG